MWHSFFTWHGFSAALLGLIALVWVVQVIDIAIGVPKIPSLDRVEPLSDADCPSVSILFAGRDEGEKIGAAVASFLAVDYPRLEVVAVNDRSNDATQSILERAARSDNRLCAVNVTELPAGWLGKTHGLQQAYEHSTGEWLVFTDADVTFAPDVLRRAVALAESKHWDHLPLFGHAEMFTFGEKIIMTFFALGFVVGMKAWRVSDPKSRFYVGVGSFQLIRRSAYEKIGAHTRLAMEVVDDIKLGKLVKDFGFRSGVATAGRRVSVHWHNGLGNIIRGTTKNFFATAQYNPAIASGQVLGVFAVSVLPWLAFFFVHGWARAFAGVAIVLAVIVQGGVAVAFEESPLYGATHPFGALILCWMLLRSMVVTLTNGGVTWRGTFYRLEDLKRGLA